MPTASGQRCFSHTVVETTRPQTTASTVTLVSSVANENLIHPSYPISLANRQQWFVRPAHRLESRIAEQQIDPNRRVPTAPVIGRFFMVFTWVLEINVLILHVASGGVRPPSGKLLAVTAL